MRLFLLSLLPAFLALIAVGIYGLLSRPGRTRVRWDSLDYKSRSDYGINVSREAAARIVGGRANQASDLVIGIVAVGALAASPLQSWAAIPLILVLAGIYTRYGRIPGLILYALMTGKTGAAFLRRSEYYRFFSDKGVYARAVRGVPEYILGLSGIGLVGSAGIPLAFGGTALPSGIPGLTLRETGLPVWIRSALMLITGLGFIIGSMRLDRWRRRRHLNRPDDVKEALAGGRPAVLLLRQFGTEHLHFPAHGGVREPLPISLIPRRSIFLEDALTWICWSWAPVVSIADPRRVRESTLGAARYQVPGDDDWQGVVDTLLETAKLIVVICGDRDGIRWEVQRILDRSDLASKAIFINPEPYSCEVVNRSLNLNLEIRQGLALLGVAISAGSSTPIWSALAEDVDYEVAVQYVARELGLFKELVRLKPGAPTL